MPVTMPVTMPPGLETLPVELFLRVVEQLADKHDLSALSLVSRKWRPLVLQALWKSISIRPRSDYSPYRLIIGHLPRRLLQFVQELHFRPASNPEGCAHARDEESPLWENESDRESEIVDWHSDMDGSAYSLNHHCRFLNLAERAVRVLDKLRDGQLSAFSWDLGTCVPSQVLGPRGIVPRKHPLLRSLSLATDPNCHVEKADWDDDDAQSEASDHAQSDGSDGSQSEAAYEPWSPDSNYDAPEAETREIDLSSFAELRSLCWISPHPAHLRTLSAALSQNSARLQHLELSFGSWRRFIRNWTKHEDDDELQRLCASRLFGLTVQSPQPIIFPAISTLSLTGVPLRVGMADALGVNTLRSLTIRGCPGWREFLKRVAESGLPMQLKAFQICDRDGQDPDNGLGHTVIGDFLGAFEGLEELFISHHGAEHALELWRHVAHHRVTLKNFVYHRRAVSLGGDDSFSSLYPHDVPDLGILPEDMCRMEESPLKNPLAALDLNFMGLCCVPQRLKPILLPFTSKTSLKVLHIRQSTTLLKAFEVPWALSMDPLKRYGLPLASPQSGSVNPIEWAAGEADGLDSANNTTTDRTDADDPSSRKPNRKPKLRPEFRQFAEWVFGPHGVRSLQLLVCGNYANDDWLRQVVLERSPGGEGNGLFRDPIVGSHRPKSVEAYRDLFEVCRVVGDWDRPQG